MDCAGSRSYLTCQHLSRLIIHIVWGKLRGINKRKLMSAAFSDSFIRNIKTTGRYTDAATQGLNLQVKVNGGKYWAMRYLFQDKRYDLSIGSYPNVSLREARIRATAARAQLNAGLRPTPNWKPQPTLEEQHRAIAPANVTFKQYAADCIAAKRAEWRNPKHAEQWSSTVEMYANPFIGNKPIDAVDMNDILNILVPARSVGMDTGIRNYKGAANWCQSSHMEGLTRDRAAKARKDSQGTAPPCAGLSVGPWLHSTATRHRRCRRLGTRVPYS
jgi:hypothetical protein